MAQTVTIEGYVYEVDYGCGEKSYTLFSSQGMGSSYYTLIGPAEYPYTIPDDFNPTAQKIADLDRQREAVRSEFAAKIRELDEKLAKLQAIEYDEATP